MSIRFAVLGLGFVGKRHAEMILAHPEAELLGVCDLLSPQDLGYTLPEGCSYFENLEAMFQALPEVEVLCVCTPNGLHAQHSLAALAAGKHVVCEKPLALRKSDCEALLYQSLHYSRHVFGVMQNRYSPPAQWLKSLLREQRLGQIFMVQVNCYWNRDERYYRPNGQAHTWKGRLDLDGGTLFTQFSHFVDMLYWLFGDITNIQGRFANFNHEGMIEFEDSGLISFDLVQGGMGCFNYSTSVWQSNLESSLTVIGERGSVKVGGQYMDKVEYCQIRDYVMPELPAANPPNDYGAYKGSAANHQYVIQNVVDVLKGRQAISTNALEGLKVVEIIEKIYALKA